MLGHPIRSFPTFRGNVTLCALATPLCIVLSVAQVRPPEFRHLTVADGLSHSQVGAICQDQQGFIWIGTRSGLNRYDGYRCEVFKHRPDDATSLSGDFVLSLLAARDGRIWIGTQNRGLNVFDPSASSFSRAHSGSPGATTTVPALLEDRTGTLWAGTTDGLFIVERTANTFTFRLVLDSASTPPASFGVVRALLETPDGSIWIGSENGICRLPRETRQRFRFVSYPRSADDPLSPSVGVVHALSCDRSGGVWVGSRSGGVRRIDPSGRIARFLPDAQERSMLTDRRGTLWLGTLDEGLFRISGDPERPVIENYRHDPNTGAGPGANEISCITEDRSGRVWLGTVGGGVSFIDPLGKKFLHVRHVPYSDSTLSANLVKAMDVDPHGGLWVGTQGGGLDVFPRGKYRCVHIPTSGKEERDNLVTALVCRRNGEIWTAYSFGGIVRMFAGRKQHMHYVHTPGDTTGLTGINVVRDMFEDTHGTLWIATHGFGVLRFDDATGTFSRYSTRDRGRLASNHIWCITADTAGNLWFGLWHGGLDRLDPATDTVTHFPARSGDTTAMTDEPNVALCAGDDGAIWIATSGSGLERLDPASRRVTHFDEQHGFPDNMVYGILKDRHADLWLSTGKGIVRFTPATGVTKVFDKYDGVQSTEFSAGACCLSPDGSMGFGGINGFNWFRPDSIEFNTVPPSVVLTGFRVFDAEREFPHVPSASSRLVLRRDENFFSLEFAALDYSAPGENQYAYRLEGFDRAWVHAGRSRRATYTNVGPGDYLFRVKASNNDGVWNEEGVALAVTILPGFWETWWFRVLVVMAFVGMGIVAYRSHINRLLAVHRTRERIARDLHDDVSAILSGIVYFSGAVETDGANRLTDKSSHFLSLIHRSSTEVLELLHDIIWSIHPEGDSLESIVTKCRRFASDLCESQTIMHDIRMPVVLPAQPVDPERRKNFWLLYKEIVANAVRHADCSLLQIHLTVEPEGRIHLMVSDNGKGFDPAHPARESGLRNIRTRTASLSGEIRLTSAPGQGTRWDLVCVLWQ
jgi:ligand-binding sensor domain-containing protein/signal transduction histidine kinase